MGRSNQTEGEEANASKEYVRASWASWLPNAGPPFDELLSNRAEWRGVCMVLNHQLRSEKKTCITS